jgi:FkbM family methyltransferase
MTKDDGTQKPTRPQSAALLRFLLATLLIPLKWLFRMVNRRQREMLAKIPGILALYRLVSPLFVSARSKDGIPCAEVNGFKMYLDPAEEASHAGAFLLGEYEPVTSAVVMALVTDGDTVVDVGAHWGYFTLLAASLCGKCGRVFAFEPHPRNFAVLKKNLEANGLTNVVAVQKAVSSRAGSTKLFQSPSAAGHSVVSVRPKLTWEGGSAHESVAVDTVTLDDFFAQGSVEPRLIKMDIEGAEPLALTGMQRLIERHPSLVLIMEFNPSYLDAQAATEFLDQLAGCGLDVAIIDDDQRQLAVGPKAAVLKRLLDEGTTCNLLATRDRPLFEQLFELRDGSGTLLGRLERVRL